MRHSSKWRASQEDVSASAQEVPGKRAIMFPLRSRRERVVPDDVAVARKSRRFGTARFASQPASGRASTRKNLMPDLSPRRALARWFIPSAGGGGGGGGSLRTGKQRPAFADRKTIPTSARRPFNFLRFSGLDFFVWGGDRGLFNLLEWLKMSSLRRYFFLLLNWWAALWQFVYYFVMSCNTVFAVLIKSHELQGMINEKGKSLNKYNNLKRK